MDDHTTSGEASEDFGYEKVDRYNTRSVGRIAASFHSILQEIGEDPDREGLAKTPERFAKALQYLAHGHDLNPAKILRSAMFRAAFTGEFEEERTRAEFMRLIG